MIISNVTKEINGKIILDGISFTLSNNDKAILVGKNGSGKSTLLKIIAGLVPKDSGSINLNGESVSILKQEIEMANYDYSIVDYIKKSLNLLDLERELHELETDLTDENMERYGQVLDQFIELDGYNFESNLAIIFNGLNLNTDYSRKVGTLSGGEKIKVLLAVVLLSNADIVLLDEPTNNLDIEAIIWLQNYLYSLNKKMIIVSHDEEFISQIATKIFELENGTLKEYNVHYDVYTQMKETEYQNALDQHERLEDEKKRLKSAIQKQKEWSSRGLEKKSKDNDKIAANFQKERTKKTSDKIAKLSKDLEALSIPDGFVKREEIDFKVDLFAAKGNFDIMINDLICGYPNFQLPSLNLVIPFGTRLQIIGPNGSGKSTFIKTIMGQVSPISGEVRLGSGVKIGYISQNSFDTLEEDISILDYLNRDGEIDSRLMFTMLTKFNIKYEERNKNYNSLSPGERTRVNLVKLALSKVNVLILDEATNHLDIEAIKLLEDVIKSFDGTIISVSHNRRFTEILSPDIILNITDGDLKYEKDVKKRKK